MSYDKRKYVLVTNASVRQSMESPSYDLFPGIAVTSENTLDLESGHYSAVCVVNHLIDMQYFRFSDPCL